MSIEPLVDPGAETKLETKPKSVRCGKIVINLEEGHYPEVVISGTVVGRDIDMLQLALTRQYMKYRQTLSRRA
ncbi:hypothetical protein CMI37_01095 [Candidatus Pacearchaeota archaeon]|nr:hypothetical protein [Candidatus Pacearchaeota archaeon]